jgi:hypothetical protein
VLGERCRLASGADGKPEAESRFAQMRQLVQDGGVIEDITLGRNGVDLIKIEILAEAQWRR